MNKKKEKEITDIVVKQFYQEKHKWLREYAEDNIRSEFFRIFNQDEIKEIQINDFQTDFKCTTYGDIIKKLRLIIRNELDRIVRKHVEQAISEIDERYNSERFVDNVVERINKKQIKK